MGLTQKEYDQLKASLNKSGELWNSLRLIDLNNSDDINDIRHHIHAIQNIIYTNLYIKENGKL
jgi:hypothetical protein